MAKRTWGEFLDFDRKAILADLVKAAVQGTLGLDPVGASVHALNAIKGIKEKQRESEQITRKWILQGLLRAIYVVVGGNYGTLARTEADLDEICKGIDLEPLAGPADLPGVLKDPAKLKLIEQLQQPLAQWLQGTDGDAEEARRRVSELGQEFDTALDAVWQQELTHTEREQIRAYILDPRTILVGLEERGPRLTLIPPRRRANRDPINSDFDLLLAHHRSTPLIGRDAELAELQGWLASDKDIAVRVLSGAAGAGKTRLAIELIEAAGEEWDAGFVDDRELKRFQSKENLADWSWTKPTLID